jgi:hypothetical protein
MHQGAHVKALALVTNHRALTDLKPLKRGIDNGFGAAAIVITEEISLDIEAQINFSATLSIPYFW